MQTVHLFLTHYAQERNSSENENILTFTARKSNLGVSKVSYTVLEKGYSMLF